MAEIVNLRRARRLRARDQAQSEAAARRARFGTPPAVRQAEQARLESAAIQLEAHRIDPPRSADAGDEE